MLLCASVWLSIFCSACGVFTKTIEVPIKPEPCNIPPFHVQADCNNDLTCYILQFVHTLQAEHTVLEALLRCPYVTIGKTIGERPFIGPIRPARDL